MVVVVVECLVEVAVDMVAAVVAVAAEDMVAVECPEEEVEEVEVCF